MAKATKVSTGGRSCPFCQVEEERVIRRSKLTTSLLSNPRLVRGHALVVPNRHVETPHGLSDSEVLSIFREMQRLQKKMFGGLADGVDQWQKSRPLVKEGTGFKVNHVHFHVLPSNPGHEMYDGALVWKSNSFQKLTDQERDEVVIFLSQ